MRFAGRFTVFPIVSWGTPMSEVLQVEVRDSRGTKNARRMRRSGHTPAVLYGHGKEVISLTISTDEINAAVRHGSMLVELKGAVKENAVINALQWDVFGTEVLHVDFKRVDADERLVVEVQVELRGEAPGTKEGGVVQQPLHAVEIDAPVSAIPDKLHININDLHVDQVLTAGDIEDLPEGVKLLTEADRVVAQCQMPLEQPEEAAEAEGTAEPEVIGRKEEEGEAEGES